jgi:hypothetical protein
MRSTLGNPERLLRAGRPRQARERSRSWPSRLKRQRYIDLCRGQRSSQVHMPTKTWVFSIIAVYYAEVVGTVRIVGEHVDDA